MHVLATCDCCEVAAGFVERYHVQCASALLAEESIQQNCCITTSEDFEGKWHGERAEVDYDSHLSRACVCCLTSSILLQWMRPQLKKFEDAELHGSLVLNAELRHDTGLQPRLSVVARDGAVAELEGDGNCK